MFPIIMSDIMISDPILILADLLSDLFHLPQKDPDYTWIAFLAHININDDDDILWTITIIPSPIDPISF